MVQMFFQWRTYGVEPMWRADEKFERLGKLHVRDPERKQGDPLAHGPLDLALDVIRFVGMGRNDEHHQIAPVDSVNDPLAPFHAGHNVAWCDPTPDTAALQRGADRVSRRFVVRGVTDENVVSHDG